MMAGSKCRLALEENLSIRKSIECTCVSFTSSVSDLDVSRSFAESEDTLTSPKSATENSVSDFNLPLVNRASSLPSSAVESLAQNAHLHHYRRSSLLSTFHLPHHSSSTHSPAVFEGLSSMISNELHTTTSLCAKATLPPPPTPHKRAHSLIPSFVHIGSDHNDQISHVTSPKTVETEGSRIKKPHLRDLIRVLRFIQVVSEKYDKLDVSLLNLHLVQHEIASYRL